MIYRKKIEEAARKYAFNKYDTTDDEVKDTYTEELQMAFEAGINWFLDNLWHDANEEPKRDGRIFVEKTYNGEKRYTDDNRETLYSSWQYKVSRENITRWLYIEDLLKGGNNG